MGTRAQSHLSVSLASDKRAGEAGGLSILKAERGRISHIRVSLLRHGGSQAAEMVSLCVCELPAHGMETA